jgi:hypothetical protein
MEEGREQMHPGAVRAPGPADGFAIHGQGLVRVGLRQQPLAQHAVEGFGVRGLEHAAQRGLGGRLMPLPARVKQAPQVLELGLSQRGGELAEGGEAAGPAEHGRQCERQHGAILMADAPPPATIGQAPDLLMQGFQLLGRERLGMHRR